MSWLIRWFVPFRTFVTHVAITDKDLSYFLPTSIGWPLPCSDAHSYAIICMIYRMILIYKCVCWNHTPSLLSSIKWNFIRINKTVARQHSLYNVVLLIYLFEFISFFPQNFVLIPFNQQQQHQLVQTCCKRQDIPNTVGKIPNRCPQ